MRGERGHPVDGEVADPDYQYWHVDRKHPEHKNKERVRIIVEVVVGLGSLDLASVTCRRAMRA